MYGLKPSLRVESPGGFPMQEANRTSDKDRLTNELLDFLAKQSDLAKHCDVCSSPMTKIKAVFATPEGKKRTINLAVCITCHPIPVSKIG